MEYMSSELDRNFGTENKCIKIFENKSNLDDSKLFEELKANNCIDDNFFIKIRTEKENEIYKSSIEITKSYKKTYNNYSKINNIRWFNEYQKKYI